MVGGAADVHPGDDPHDTSRLADADPGPAVEICLTGGVAEAVRSSICLVGAATSQSNGSAAPNLYTSVSGGTGSVI